MLESERRSETRQRDRLNSTSGLGSNEEILVYSPDADILRRYPALKGIINKMNVFAFQLLMSL